MATASPAQQSAIVNLYVALFNRAPDAAGFEFWTQALANGAPLSVVTGAFFISPETTAIYPAAQNAQAFVSVFYQTVFGRAPDAEGLVFWTNVLNAAGGPTSQSAKALLVSKIVDIVSAPLSEKPAGLTDAQYAETVHDRELFSKKNVAALDFAINVKSNDLDAAKQVLVDVVTPTVPGPPQPTDMVITLTAQDETMTGGDGNDTFNGKGFFDAESQAYVDTLNDGDVLDGGAGTDTLNAHLYFCGSVTPTLKNIEVVRLASTGSSILDLAKATGVEQAGLDGSTNYGGFSNVGNAALFVSNQTTNVEFRDSNAQNLSLTLSKVGMTGALIDVNLLGDTQASAYTVVATDAFAALRRDESGASVFGVTVKAAGSNAITLSGIDAGTVQTVSVTGSGSVDFSGQAFSSQLTKFAGGRGNDSIAFDGAPATGAIINGGDGRDTFGTTVQGYAELKTHSPQDLALISNFEVLKITNELDDAVIDLGTLSGVTSFVAGGGLGGKNNSYVSNLGTNATVEIQGKAVSSDSTLHLALADASSSNDALTLVLNTTPDYDHPVSVYEASNAIDITQIETLNVVSTASSDPSQHDENTGPVRNTISLSDESKSLKTLNVTGDHAFEFYASSAQDNLAIIDASALKATTGIYAYNYDDPVALTIKGSLTASNRLIGSNAADTITGGATVDFITGGVGSDSLTGGGGNDTFVYTQPLDSDGHVVDVITDFKANTIAETLGGEAAPAESRDGDVLRLSVNNPSNPMLVSVQANDVDVSDFIVSAANDGASSAVLNLANSRLFVDSNADGDVDYVIELSGVKNITAAAFSRFID